MNRLCIWAILLALYYMVAASAAATQPGPYVSLEGDISALEERLFDDGNEGKWQRHDLLTAALIASGEDRPNRLEHYRAKVKSLGAELERTEPAGEVVERKAQQIHEFLHRRVLGGGYRLDATDLRVTIDEGRFNCVSASVLFVCLARRCGLATSATEVPGHAMSRIALPEGGLDIETTCPDWFRLAKDPKRRAELVERAIGRTGGVKDRPQPRQVSDMELVATIYYNRGVNLLGERRFAEALAANAKSLRLDPANATARGNLLATINNWAISLGAEGQFDRAAELLRLGLSLDPAYGPFRSNYLHLHRQWVAALASTGNLDQLAATLAAVEADPYLADREGDLASP